MKPEELEDDIFYKIEQRCQECKKLLRTSATK